TYSTLYLLIYILFFFFNDPATTEIYTLSLHDALPIFFVLQQLAGLRKRLAQVDLLRHSRIARLRGLKARLLNIARHRVGRHKARSEEHTSELQSRGHLVCRLLLEKKKILI